MLSEDQPFEFGFLPAEVYQQADLHPRGLEFALTMVGTRRCVWRAVNNRGSAAGSGRGVP